MATPKQNGVVERKHKHLLETARALLFHSALPIKYWGECVLTASYLINRFPSKVLKGMSPFSILFGKKPSYDHLKVFGSLCYASTLKSGRDKFQARAIPCIFLGYPFGQKAYKLLNLETHQVFTSRDVIFHETILPYKHVSNNTGSVLFPLTDPHIIYYDEQQPAASTESHDQSLTPSLSRTENSSESTLLPVRRSSRLHKTPSYLTEYVCSNVLTQSSDIQTSHCSNTITSFCCNATSHASFNITSNDISQSPVCYSEPNSYEEAASKPEWQEAMQKEFEALRANNTWELVALPKGKKPISCKWVYKIKYKADGSLERCKARLVVRGFTQKEGVDYTETFSPVVKMTTIRSLIAVAVKKHWPIYQMDVNNAFLHGDLHEDIYMKPPQGLPVSSGNIVCKLKKSLYGLKQASRQWYAKLSDTLRSVGFQHSQNDYSLFCKQQDSCFLFVAVYVDDIIVTGNDPDEINTLKVFLDNKFRIKDLGELNYFLGMEVTKFPNGVALTQKKFAADLIKEFHCDRLPPTNCPLGPLCKSADEADLFADVTTYRKLMGKLNYLTNTRPDIAFSVQYLSQFLQAPTKSQWTATLHTLRYIKRDPSQGLFFNNSHDFNLTAYCVILIGHNALVLDDLLVAISLCLVAVLSLGSPRNNPLLLCLLLRQSIDL